MYFVFYLTKFQGVPAAGDIKPNFDVEMNLIGWYNTKDQSGGQNTWLKKPTNHSDEYLDDREVMKYYKQNDNGNWLFAYDPQYV